MARASPGVVLLTLVQIGCSVAVITLTNDFLVTGSSWDTGTSLCYLNGDKHDVSMCSFAVAVGVVSICIALFSGCLRCVSCDCCGLGPVSNILLDLLNSLWWLVSSAILTAGTAAADASDLPRGKYRHALLAAAWTAAVAELIHSILACVVVGNNICNWICCTPTTEDEESLGGCCCCSRQRRHTPHHPHHHHTQPLLPSDAAAAAASLAAAGAFSKRSWWPRVTQQQRPQQQGAGGVGAGGWGSQRPAAASSGGYMPPPPTAGQPYVYPPAAAAPAVGTAFAVGVPLSPGSSQPDRPAAAAPGIGGSFGGFIHNGTAGWAGNTPTGFVSAPPSRAAVAPGAHVPYAPPVVIRQQHVAPSMPNMDAEAYPTIPRS